MPNNQQPMTFADAIITLLRDTRDALVRIVERRWGIVRAYIEDIRDNIRFEDSRIESVVFQVLIGAGGAIAAQPATQRIHPEYLFAMRRMMGFVQDPAVDTGDIARVEFTIREQGRGQDVFLTPQNLAQLIPGSGSDRFDWETPYVFREAAEITLAFAVNDAAGWVGGADRRFGVVIIGDLVRKKILP